MKRSCIRERLFSKEGVNRYIIENKKYHQTLITVALMNAGISSKWYYHWGSKK